MSSESLHAPRERLSTETFSLHHAIVSLMEELDAVDWYRQRADDCEDGALRDILLHNMREEMEHAAMVLEWIRRNNADFSGHLKTYLFAEGPILEVEKAVTASEARGQSARSSSSPRTREDFTIGPLRKD